MSTRQDHIQQWKHNRQFASSIEPEYHDWIVTAIFYTAVHAIDTLLAHDKVVIHNHETRNKALQLTNRYEFINKKYDALYSLCRTIRYLAHPTQWIPADRLQKDVVQRYLYPIEKSVQKLINQDIGLSDLVLKV